MKGNLLLIGILFVATAAWALLPPYYESSKEIKAILEDPTVIEKITSGRVIKSIVKTHNGYLITAGPKGECTLNVNIQYLPPATRGYAGPAQYDIVSEKLECKK